MCLVGKNWLEVKTYSVKRYLFIWALNIKNFEIMFDLVWDAFTFKPLARVEDYKKNP